MKYVIGDIGNTNTKIGFLDKNFNFVKILNFETKKIKNKIFLKKKLDSFFKKKNIFPSILLASVVDHAYIILKKYFLKKNFNVFEIQEKNINKIVKINLKKPKEVGSDRIANAVAAFKIYKKNCIILDFGTATNFDVVTDRGIYQGGLIAPGINISIKNLNKETDRLPIFKLKKQKNIIGKNTVEALRSGFFWGYQGLIEKIILKILKKSKWNYKIIYTGGYARLFYNFLNLKVIVDQNITLKGISEILKKNIKNLNK